MRDVLRKCPVVGCEVWTDTMDQFIGHAETHIPEFERATKRSADPDISEQEK